MKKWKKIVIASVCLVGLVATYVWAQRPYEPTKFPGGIKITPARQGQEQYAIQVENAYNAGTTIFSVDNFGRINQEDFVVINSYTDLRSWTGVAAGSSYFQTDAGKTYLVDLVAINNSSLSAPAGSGVTNQSWSAVTAMLPFVSGGSDHMRDVTIMIAHLSSDALNTTGATNLQVWPGPSESGITQVSGATPLQMMSVKMTNSGATSAASATSPFNSMFSVGQSVTFKLFYNSGISALMTNFEN